MLALPPYGLGLPSDNAISNYYLGNRITREEIAHATKAAGRCGIEPENTRIRKSVEGVNTTFEILQASVETGVRDVVGTEDGGTTKIRLINGDHAEELAKICFQ